MVPSRPAGLQPKKIEPDPQAPRYIITEPGVGYRFVTSRG
jgi:DNA-binding response OmpR family regulator